MSDSPVQFELRDKRVFVAGHTGMVGSALIRRLGLESCKILTAKRLELDLRRCEQVDRWMAKIRPDAVFLAAGKVGGTAFYSKRRLADHGIEAWANGGESSV
jgi:GDP-L-fucose synthase